MTAREKRQGIRVPFRTQIVIRYGANELHLEGSSKNVSRNGMLIRTETDIPLGTECRIELTLAGTEPPMVLSMAGRVVRDDPGGYGLRFEEMDLDSFTLLKEIVRHNTSEPDQV